MVPLEYVEGKSIALHGPDSAHHPLGPRVSRALSSGCPLCYVASLPINYIARYTAAGRSRQVRAAILRMVWLLRRHCPERIHFFTRIQGPPKAGHGLHVELLDRRVMKDVNLEESGMMSPKGSKKYNAD